MYDIAMAPVQRHSVASIVHHITGPGRSEDFGWGLGGWIHMVLPRP
jgi:hypothetical protein